MNSDLFTKRIDNNGTFYYVRNETGEITYDTPHGDVIPLDRNSSLTESQKEAIENEARKRAAQKELKRKERLELIKKNQYKHEKEQKKIQARIKREAAARLDDIWKKSCDSAKADGVLNLDWQNLGYISERIYRFHQTYDLTLTKLSLKGNALLSLGSLTSRCCTLRELLLASNKIQILEPEISQLILLQVLDLSNNDLSELPISIGGLTQLQVFDLSNNKLTELPSSLKSLKSLKVLNAECNRLKQLDECIGQMEFEKINVSSNQLSTLPRTIGSVKSLKVLLANDNALRNIPIGLCYSSIEVLHLSKNKVMELPKAFQNLVTLESLWMDFNKISALPHGFHHLRRLQELKINGNVNLVFPPIRVIAKGAKEVLKWCEVRLASDEFSRQRNIMLSVLSILEQIGVHNLRSYASLKEAGQYKDEQPLVAHESIYEAEVLFEGDTYYQFDSFNTFFNDFVPAMEKIWSETSEVGLKAAITSFPYERREVEQVLADFRDAGGKIVKQNNEAYFRRCRCIDHTGVRRVCVPPKVGWMCKRRAIMVRMHFVLESTMVERRRILLAQKRIEEAVEAAKKVATTYLDSEEGLETVRLLAEQQLLARQHLGEAETYSIPLKQLSLANIDSLDLQSLRAKSRARRNLANEKSPVERFLGCLHLGEPLHDEDIAEEISKIRQEFFTHEVDARRSNAMETNRKIKKVMDAWLGCTIEDIFREWKIVVVDIKRDRQKSQLLKTKELKRLKQEEEEHALMAQKELSLWKKFWDEFNDQPYWAHALTREVRYEEPTLNMVRGKGWTHPELRAFKQRSKAFRTNLSLNDTTREGRLEKEAFGAAKKVLERRRRHLKNTEELPLSIIS